MINKDMIRIGVFSSTLKTTARILCIRHRFMV